jgi:hypothetical protein
MKCVMAMKKAENKVESKPKVNALAMSDKFPKKITVSDKLKKPLSKSKCS